MIARVRTVVLGAGHLGFIHARLLRELQNVEIIGVIDPSPEARRRVAEELHLPVFEELRQPLLSRCEAAIVAAPTPLHLDIGRRLVSAGIHVLMEKPLCPTSEQCQELIRLADQHQCQLQVGHVERFNPAYQTVRQHLQRPHYIEAQRRTPFSQRSMETSVVLDLMIHDIDLVLGLVSSPVVRVQAWGQSLMGEPLDAAQVRLDFHCGCIANLTASRIAARPERSLSIWDQERQWDVDMAERAVREIVNEGQSFRVRPCSVPDTNPLSEEQRDFFDSIQGQRRPIVPGTAGRDAVNIAERVHESIESQRQLMSAASVESQIRRVG